MPEIPTPQPHHTTPRDDVPPPLPDDVTRCVWTVLGTGAPSAWALHRVLIDDGTAGDDRALLQHVTRLGREQLRSNEAIEAAMGRRGRRRHGGWQVAITPTDDDATPGAQAATVHLALTVATEWSIHACRTRLAELAGDHPVAHALRQANRRELGPVELLRADLEARLGVDPRARAAARWALASHWAPAGTGALAPADGDHLLGALFGTWRGRAVATLVDLRIDTLPGLAGLGLVEAALPPVPPTDIDLRTRRVVDALRRTPLSA